MKARSLTKQTVAVALAAQLVCAAVLCGAALLHELHSRTVALDAQLQGRSDSLLGAVQDAEDPNSNVAIDPAELKVPPHDAFAVYNQGGTLLGASPQAPAALIARSSAGLHEVRVSRETYRVLQRDALRVIDRAEYGGVGLRRPITIVYAMPEGHLRHEVFEAARFYIVTILLVTAATALMLPLLLRRTLRPLADLASATGKIGPPAFAFHPPASALELDELRPLAEVLDRSIQRVQQSFLREQRFVSDAAHELKTAVAVLRSTVQLMLLKRRSEDEYRAGLDRAVEDVERLEALVGQMLQLARVEETATNAAAAGGADAQARADRPQTDLAEMARAVASRLQPVAMQRNVEIRVDAAQAPAQLPLQVALRPDLAEVLLSNLVLNALQHSDAASAPIAISVQRGADGTIDLRVTDGGSGIAPEVLPHIFERFYRADTSRSRETGGTGLGLAIVKSIVDAAHGRLHVESTVGGGTTMRVTFTSA